MGRPSIEDNKSIRTEPRADGKYALAETAATGGKTGGGKTSAFVVSSALGGREDDDEELDISPTDNVVLYW